MFNQETLVTPLLVIIAVELLYLCFINTYTYLMSKPATDGPGKPPKPKNGITDNDSAQSGEGTDPNSPVS